MGFGDLTSELFRELPVSPDGTLNYIDVLRNINTNHVSNAMKSFMTALVCDSCDVKDIDTSGWSFTGHNVESARRALAKLLRSKEARLSDVFDKIDEDRSSTITEPEFHHAMLNVLNFQGSSHILFGIWDAIDEDGVPKTE